MNTKKHTLIIVTILLISLVITGGSYAFWTWSSNTTKNVVFNTSGELKDYIVYDEGESTFSGNFEASDTFEDGMHTTISIYKTSEAANVDLYATINMDINNIGTNMANSPAFKWVVTEGTSSDPGNVLDEGNFIGASSGSTVTLVAKTPVSVTETFYTIWLWLDINENPSENLLGEVFDGKVWTEINLDGGIETRYEFTQLYTNYQMIKATILNNKHLITSYAITTTNNEPSTWTEIVSNEQDNVYHLSYITSGLGTYYIWVKDNGNNIISNSIQVTELDDIPPTGTSDAKFISGDAVLATINAKDIGLGLATEDVYGWKLTATSTCDSTLSDFVVNDDTEYTFTTDVDDKYYVCVRVKDISNNYGYISSPIKAYLKVVSNDADYKVTAYKDNITAVSFANSVNTSGATATFDLSSVSDNRVVGWLKSDGSGAYNLTIGSNYSLYAQSLYALFSNMRKLSNINMTYLNTSEAVNMASMFKDTGTTSTSYAINLGSDFNTLNVTNMAYMFWNTGNNTTTFSLNLGDKFNTSNVRDMYMMFRNVGRKATSYSLDLGNNFDTSKVVNMNYMFSSVANNTTTFTLNLGDKFDTSNAIDMGCMFSSMGPKLTTWNLDLGNKFDTSNVTRMGSMFSGAGVNSSSFSLNLGNNFNTWNVSVMNNMFYQSGRNATSWNLNLGNNFDTSNVTTVASMFDYAGAKAAMVNINLGNKVDLAKSISVVNMFDNTCRYANVCNIDLGDNFNASLVTNMYRMFYLAGQNTNSLYIDLGNNFNASNVTSMDGMFQVVGQYAKNVVIDLGNNFNSVNVINMNNMFSQVAQNATNLSLDLGNNFLTSNVTDMTYMFAWVGLNTTNFNANLGNKINTSKVTTMLQTFENFGNKSTKAFTIDLSSGNFTNVTNYTNTFRGVPSGKVTIYVKDSTARSWITGKNSNWGTSFSTTNVLIK